jgi:hypothetical protein
MKEQSMEPTYEEIESAHRKKLKAAYRTKLKEGKICTSCCKCEVVGKSCLCEICTLKKTSRAHFKTTAHWEELGHKLVAQNCRCPYTGLRLHPGTNASLDHIVARSEGGPDTLENVEWVHVWINLMKNRMGKEEFAEELRAFVAEAHRFLSEGKSE